MSPALLPSLPPPQLALAHTQSTYTALHEACYNGHKLVVARLLVAKGELWRLKDTRGKTPAGMARERGKEAIATAIELWGTGNRAGALRQLGYTRPSAITVSCQHLCDRLCHRRLCVLTSLYAFTRFGAPPTAPYKYQARSSGVVIGRTSAPAPAPAGSRGEPVESAEKVCLDLYLAARWGKLEEVTRLLSMAEEKGVVNKVTRGVTTQRRGRDGGRET